MPGVLGSPQRMPQDTMPIVVQRPLSSCSISGPPESPWKTERTLGPCWEADDVSACHDTPRLLCNAKSHDHVHKRSSFITLRQLSPRLLLDRLKYYLHLCLGVPSSIFIFEFSTKTVYGFLTSARMLCSISVIIFGEQYKLRSNPLRTFPHHRVSPFFFCPQFLTFVTCFIHVTLEVNQEYCL